MNHARERRFEILWVILGVVVVSLWVVACEPPDFIDADCSGDCEDVVFVEVRDTAGELVHGVSGRASYLGRQVSFDCRGAQLSSNLHECVPGGVMLRGAPGSIRLEIFNEDGSLMKVGDLSPSYEDHVAAAQDVCEFPVNSCRHALVSIAGVDYPRPAKWALLEDVVLEVASEEGSSLDAVALIKADGAVFFAAEVAPLSESAFCEAERSPKCDVTRAKGEPDSVKGVEAPMMCPEDVAREGFVALSGRSIAVSFAEPNGKAVYIEPGDRVALLGAGGADCEGGEVPFMVGVSTSAFVEGPYRELGVVTPETPQVIVP